MRLGGREKKREDERLTDGSKSMSDAEKRLLLQLCSNRLLDLGIGL